MQVITHYPTQFAVLGGKQGHYMLVIGPIAHMIIYKYIRIALVKDGGKGAGLSGIAFYKIAVKVEVLGIAAGTKLRRPVLSGPVPGTADETSANIIYRNNGKYHIIGQLCFAGGNIAHQ